LYVDYINWDQQRGPLLKLLQGGLGGEGEMEGRADDVTAKVNVWFQYVSLHFRVQEAHSIIGRCGYASDIPCSMLVL
jgi:hypothetical protein